VYGKLKIGKGFSKKPILNLLFFFERHACNTVTKKKASCLKTNVINGYTNTVIPRLTKIIRFGITFVSRNLR